MNHAAAITEAIIGAAIDVHRELGPGLLESTYAACLANELGRRGGAFETQKRLPVRYRDVLIDAGYRIDFLVENQVILELKSVDKLTPLHEAQLLSYLKLSGCRTGLLINFNVHLLKYGVRRRILSD